LIEAGHEISVKRQCELLGLSRGAYYYEAEDARSVADLKLLKGVRRVLGMRPFYGYRKVAREMAKSDRTVTEKQIRRILRRFGLMAVFPGRNLSRARAEHKKYPYLLAGKIIRYPNQVWSTDLTYIKIGRGFVYLMAIIDLYSLKTLCWRTFNTMDAAQYAALLEEAIAQYGCPAVFNTDQGSQFTSDVWIDVLTQNGIRVSMDGKNRALDNIFIERLWRSVKYEDIYLNRYESVIELKRGLTKYFNFYNRERFHQSLDYLTPDVAYQSFQSVGLESDTLAA
jgi:putative transposase